MIRQAYHSFLSLIYPPLCLHCESRLDKLDQLFCEGCSASMELCGVQQRCRHCFKELPDRSVHVCNECVLGDILFKGVGAAFNYEGPAASLIKRLKSGSEPHLAKGAGAFLAAQWAHLGWPLPDLIVPVPQRFSHWIDRGYNQSRLLADAFGKLLSRPVAPLLACKSMGAAQTGLSKEQRKQMPGEQFFLKKRAGKVEDRTICLIDDVMTTGTTLKACAKALLCHSPAQVYALVVCKANVL